MPAADASLQYAVSVAFPTDARQAATRPAVRFYGGGNDPRSNTQLRVLPHRIPRVQLR